MKPTQSEMNDLYTLASGRAFDDAPKVVRDALPFLAMKHDDTESELHDIEGELMGLTLVQARMRGHIDRIRAARDAFNAATVDLIEGLERYYAPESDRDAALATADHCYEYRTDGAE